MQIEPDFIMEKVLVELYEILRTELIGTTMYEFEKSSSL